jgi:peptidoglycan/xylan/chitin deacetylase (PgdA/CDA1 family)
MPTDRRMGRRERLARLGLSSGLLPAWGELRLRVGQPDLRVLAYHRVLPHPAGDEQLLDLDLELVSAWSDRFDSQLDWLTRNAEPVSLAQVLAAQDGGARLPRRAVLVTFDDGFDDNLDVALPLLLRHGVPAVFFIATGIVGSNRRFWFDAVVWQLLRTKAARLHLPALDCTLEPAAHRPGRRAQAASLLARLKRLPDARRVAALAELTLASGVDEHAVDPAETLAPARPMDWSQVRRLAQAGMALGSHTVSHPVLARVSDDEALALEMVASRLALREHGGVDTCALAYPVGGPDALDDRVLRAVAAAGYRIAFTYQGGSNRRWPASPLTLRRLHVERDQSDEAWRAALHWPGVFGV